MSDLLPATEPTATLMDGIYRYQRHIYDVSRHYYLLGRDRMIAELDVPAGGTVLEVGCGTARNLVAIARAYPDAEIYGIDISTEMLKSADATVRKARLQHRVRPVYGDAADLDAHGQFGLRGFDRIVFSYSLSMIPPWRHALASAVDNLAPGGEIHIVDFAGQRDLPAWFGKGLRTWLDKFHVSPRLEVGTELALQSARVGGSARVRSIHRDYAMIGRLKRGPLR
ncbi:class I SAM-dependent methyltransferase [Pseudohoeflea suaedae]|uniref:Class I SAM-dependent methyltransferase n=1 Tax=Pseudohoeflea suaedae TaxID=877384 RepID=A0A4V3A720_9HYPH|nr:class I SAM-dependent methyltransferase [Pseudohoeflea suaedae]TDH35832.1 class I SAM-dependent methyltransferase [Pseudohoeflea suaedae]